MKEKKTIRIKNPYLRNLRKNLRLILLKAEGKKSSELENLALSFYYDENKRPLKNITPEVKKKSSKYRREVKELERSLRKSICYCPVCGQIDKDMTYNPQVEKWYCVECYRDLPANLKPDWEPDYPLTEAQIKEFFKQLNRRADRCGATFRHSREVLQGMDISRADQIKFINICKEYGGYNDIEILMNAQKEIYDDFGIEIQ